MSEKPQKLDINFRVDSSEIAFLQVGEGIMQQVFDRGDKSILEPVMTVEISYPVEFDSRVNMLLADRSVDVTDTETDYLVSSSFILSTALLVVVLGVKNYITAQCLVGRRDFLKYSEHFD